MNRDNHHQPAARQLQTRVGNLTHQLLSADDYDTALQIATELFDCVHALLETPPVRRPASPVSIDSAKHRDPAQAPKGRKNPKPPDGPSFYPVELTTTAGAPPFRVFSERVGTRDAKG